MKSMLKARGTSSKRSKKKYDVPLSRFAFKCNLRRYMMAIIPAHIMRSVGGGYDNESLVGRCRLTVSKPVLKAPMVSALEAII